MNDIIQFRNLPNELKWNGLFCGWKLTDRGKVPFNLETGEFAKSNDSTTFKGYPILLKNVHKFLKTDDNGKQLGGIGLGIFRGYSAVDIDHCIDDSGISDLAWDIIKYLNSYTEISPSKTGIRIIFKTNVKIDKDYYYINNHNNGVEIYISDNTNKFVTLTGNRLSDEYSKINDVDIQYVLDKYMRKSDVPVKKTEARHNTNITLDLNRIMAKDRKLASLWNSTAPGSHANESELDMALCSKLAYYCQNDVDMIRNLFESSPYYASKDEKHLKKWNETQYSVNTINAVLNPDNVKPKQVSTRENKKYELNDTGNARRFIDHFGDILRYNVDNNMWMIWNDNYWQYDVKEQVKNYVEIMAEEMLFESNNENDLNTRTRILRNIDHIYSSSGKESLLKEARHIESIPILNSELDMNDYLLCTNNGTINLQDGTIYKSEKQDLISMSTGCDVSFDEPKLWIKFLNDMFPNEPEIIHYIQKALGYSLTNSAREQCMFILYGDGNNGKSLLLDTIKNVLGSYAITSKPQLLTEQRYASGNSEEIARTKGKRFIPVEEIKSGDRLDEQLIKSLTSGIGNQVARFLYGNSFEFAFKGKIWIATNYEPIIRGTDKGIWRRMVKIPVRVDFTGREDKDLKDKLLTEKSQILGWLIEGYKMYQKEGLAQPEIIKEEIKNYQEEMDIVQQWVNECCECDNKYFEKANVLYDNFRAYCQRRDERTNQTIFGRNLTKKFKKRQYSSGVVYLGIRLRKEQENLAKKVAFDRIEVSDDI